LYELWDRYPAISVVVLSAQLDHNRVVKALDRGARGFISKSAQREVMLGALRLVFAGGIYIPPEAIAREEPPPPPKATISRLGAQVAHVTPADLGLTGQQLDVLALLMQRSNGVNLGTIRHSRAANSVGSLSPEYAVICANNDGVVTSQSRIS